MSAKNDIQVKIGSEGEGRLIATLGRLRTASDRVKAPLVKDVKRIGQVTKAVGGIGVAAAGIGAGGVTALYQALQKAKGIAAETATALDSIARSAVEMGSKSPAALAGLGYAFEMAGLDGIEGVKAAGTAYLEFVKKLKSGDEEAAGIAEGAGFRFSDFFDFDPETGDFRAASKSVDDFLMSLFDNESFMSSRYRRDILADIFGEDQGNRLDTFFAGGKNAVDEQIEYFNKISGLTDEAIDYGVIMDKLNRDSAIAIDGLKNKFSQGMFPALYQNADDFQEWAVENQDRMKSFGTYVGSYLRELEPLFLEASTTAMKLLAGEGDALEDSPLKSTLESLIQLAKDFGQGVIDLLKYLNTGETDAPWLLKTLEFLDKVRNAAIVVFGKIEDLSLFISTEVAPVVSDLIDIIDGLFESLGVSDDGAKLGITAGLLIFSGTIKGAIKLIASLIGGIWKLSGAAAGAASAAKIAAAGAGAGDVAKNAAKGGAKKGGALSLLSNPLAAVGAAWAASIYTGMENLDAGEMLDEIGKDAARLAETHGEAYAAAYLRAAIDEIQTSNLTSNTLNSLASKVGLGPSFDDSKGKLDTVIAGGTAEDAAAGAAAAFARYGWDIEAGGQVQIGAGLTIDALELSERVKAQLDGLGASLEISAPAAAAAAEIRPTGPAGAGMSPVNISIDGAPALPGLYTDRPADLARAAAQSKRARS